MVVFTRHDRLEVVLLKLTAAQFPLPRSLHALVLDLYAPDIQAGAAQTMSQDEVLRYLKSIDSFELSPLQAIRTQAEAMGDPAVLGGEQAAILEWLNTAYNHWEQRFPIEEPLASELRKLLPLGAALAITDPDFLTPGAHSFHRLLDALQASVVGWQSRLGRAGQSMAQQLEATISTARTWFDGNSDALPTACEELIITAQKNKSRAQRMAKRVVEAEQGRLKTAQAKTHAAQMINQLLEKYQAPPDVGEFLKGPWYESGQLIVLRFGAQSKEWAGMSATSEALLDSLQSEPRAAPDQTDKGSGSRRQQLFEAITKLPREIRRCLISLQHHEHEIDNAIGVIESAHMAVLRQQDLNLHSIEPIQLSSTTTAEEDPLVLECIAALAVGQWFLLSRKNSEPLRLQLVLKMASEQQLLFTNHAGMKAAQESYAYFAASLKAGTSTPLPSEVSFSGSLALAAKISSEEDLESLNSTAALQARQAHRAAIAEQRESDRDTHEREREDQARLHREFDEALAAKREQEARAARQREKEQEPVHEQQRQRDAADQKQKEQDLRHQSELEETARLMREYEVAEQQRDRAEELTGLDEGFLGAPQPEAKADPAPDLTPTVAHSVKANNGPLIMGAWLGFHDGEKPLMAKLAAHDKENDNYIFVNREGIKMRQLSKSELRGLMDRGLVEVLEAHSNFKDEDTRARNNHRV